LCGTLLLLTFFCVISADVISGPLYAVGVAPITGGISFNTYDLTMTVEPLVGFSSVANTEGGSWTDSARMDIDRNGGVAYFVAVSNSRLLEQSGRNVTLFKYRYAINNQILAVPQELSRCRFGGDIFMMTELFLSSTRQIYGILRINGGVGLLQISEDCSFKILLNIPAPVTRVQLYLKEDLLYFPSAGGLNEINLNTLDMVQYALPLTNRRWGLNSYIALDQNTGTIFMTNTNGNFGDRRWFTFDQTNQTIVEDQSGLRGLATFQLVQVFNLKSQPLLGYVTGRRWLAVDPIEHRLDMWNSSTSLNAPDRSDWRFHNLDTN